MYSAFYTGLRAALFLSAALVLAAGLFTVALESRRQRSRADRHPGPLITSGDHHAQDGTSEDTSAPAGIGNRS